jgi:Flp pilus assembly protein TadG
MNTAAHGSPWSKGSHGTSAARSVLSALMMTALLGVGALAVDLGNAYAVKAQLQNAADPGSLTARKLVLTS